MLDMLDKVPKNAKEGQKARESLTDKAWLIHEAQDWARITIESDQKVRSDTAIKAEKVELQNEYERLGIDIVQYEAFLESNPQTEDEIALKHKTQKFIDKFKSDKDNQTSLKLLLDKIGGFPSIAEYGRNVAHTAWIVFQHADNDREMQKKGLKLMYQCRKERPNEASVELTDFYYLTDRITMALYGYQFFGTQNKGASLIGLPESIKLNFARNPTFFCLQLVENQLSDKYRTSSSDTEMYFLWLLAAQDSQKFGIEDPQANENVAEYEKNIDL